MSLLKRVETDLQGTPETVVTWGLIGTAVFLIIVALNAGPITKVAVLAWVIAP